MNKYRRKELRSIIDRLEELRSDLETLKEEEEEYMENMPENLQGSEKHEAAEEAVSNLEDALSSLEDAASSIEEAIQSVAVEIGGFVGHPFPVAVQHQLFGVGVGVSLALHVGDVGIQAHPSGRIIQGVPLLFDCQSVHSSVPSGR